MAKISIAKYDAQRHHHLVDAIVKLHVACIQHDNSLMRFHPPFDSAKRAKMAQFWTPRLAATTRGLRTTLLAFAPSTQADCEDELCGIVELETPDADTGPFRGGVEMLMVSPGHQRKGIAGLLMRTLEQTAVELGRTLLQLGTTKDSAAEVYLYPKLGYVKVGEVPEYGIEPNTCKLVDGVLFYKDLRS